jgi:nitrous oxide reductase accessory protein NosL
MKRLAGLALVAVALAGCGAAEERKESAAESTHEAAIEQKQQAAEEHCKDKGEIIAQGNDETTECVSNEQKQHEIESGEKSGPHYEAEQQANENEEQNRKNEEAEKIESERSGG